MECLSIEYRNGIKECVHRGRIAIVDGEREMIRKIGNIDTITFFRSASKPIQVLPLLTYGIQEKYDLSEKEIAVMSGSQGGEPEHVSVLEKILEKTELREEELIIKPCYPEEEKAREELLKRGEKKRSLYHLCAGKHLAAMLLQKELTGTQQGYWEIESEAQRCIRQYISIFCDIPCEQIYTGIDGCGVPVFAVPQYKIASAYCKLAVPENTNVEKWKREIKILQNAMNRNPVLVRRTGHLCSILNEDKNLIVKDGSQGVLGIGMKKQHLGIAIKIEDGSEKTMPCIVKEIFRQLKYDNAVLMERLEKVFDEKIYNNQGDIIGDIRAAFHYLQIN